MLVLSAVLAHATPAAETRTMNLDGQETAVDLHLPAYGPPRGLAVIAHGFTRSRARHVVLAGRLADAGFVVAVPDLPYWARPHANADAIVELVQAVEKKRGADVLPVVLIGTSAGGLASLLATDRVPQLALWVGLDPVDTLGLSEGAARALRAPAVVLRAPAARVTWVAARGGSRRGSETCARKSASKGPRTATSKTRPPCAAKRSAGRPIPPARRSSSTRR